MMSTITSRNSVVDMFSYSKTARVHQGVQTEKIAGQSVQSHGQTDLGNAEYETFSALLSRQKAAPVEANSPGFDMTQTTRSQMMDWVNDKIRSGSISLDEGFPFMAISMKVPADGSAVFGMHNLDDSEPINLPEMISKGMEAAERRGDQQTLDMLMSAQNTLQKSSNDVLTARESQQIANMTASPIEAPLSFDDIAKKYDVTSMTPIEVDQMVREMTENNAAPLKDLMMLSTYGAEFRAHLQAHARAAGLGNVSLGTTEYDSGMNEKKNILDIVTAQKAVAQNHGEPTESYDRRISLLERMAAVYQRLS